MKTNYKLKEITTKEMQCAFGACPAIYEVEEITPESMRCSPLPVCPGIYAGKGSEESSYFIIGTQINPEDAGLAKKIGEGEVLIKVPRKLIDGIGK